MPELCAREVEHRARALHERLAGSNVIDAPMQAELERELAALRALFRRDNKLFSEESIKLLRVAASQLVRNASADAEEAEAAEARASGREHAASNFDLPHALSQAFGYHDFRTGQREIVETVLCGRDCVGVMPTGAGKSLTYQLPARLLPHITLVISPLIALMKDQVDSVTEFGFKATFLNSTLTPEEREARRAAVKNGEYELVYVAPEGIEASLGRMLKTLPVSLIAVDEAHCISQWGHDFRPAYRNLRVLRSWFPKVPILALTATATEDVTSDIVEQLGLKRPALFRGSFFRPNLKLSVYKKGESAQGSTRKSILQLVQARRGQSGIIYCLSRKACEQTATFLQEHGVKAEAYHAGLDAKVRAKVQDAFRADDLDVVTATIAFGMGIDKSNIRYVIHRDMPRSLEGYYQEIGRAGRDGLDSDCVLFYSWSEVRAYDSFAGASADEFVIERQRGHVREMFQFAETRGCRHQGLVQYFGETLGPCGSSCDVCSGEDPLATAQRNAPLKKKKERRAEFAQEAELELDNELLARLKRVRKKLAEERQVPAYVIFSDATLLEIANRRPASLDEFALISGVGPTKLERYAKHFLVETRR